MTNTHPYSVEEALRTVLAHAHPLDTENCPLREALGRVLADDILSNRDLPPHDVSAMDGFAVHSVDTQSGALHLTIIETIEAGDRPQKTLARGQCARIMTGAPLPIGADAVVRIEDTQLMSPETVEIRVAVSPQHDVRPQGESMRTGQCVLPKGTEISPAAFGILASVKAHTPRVYRSAQVAILSTGNELEALEAPLDPHKTPDSNTYTLLGQCQTLGAQASLLGIARDDLDEVTRHIAQGLQADVLLISGGSSMGIGDFVRPALEALQVQIHFWRVNMRPGHPLVFGTTPKGTLVFGLPGNPVSSMVCFDNFVLPALRQMMGHQRCVRHTVTARLLHDIKTRAGRTEFVRVMLQKEETGEFTATATGAQSSGILLSMAEADGLLIVPASESGLRAGSLAEVALLDRARFTKAPL